MNIFYIFLPILTLINISVQDAIITPSGAIALAKIQQQKSKAIAHVLKTRAERNIAKAKLQYSLPQKSLWRRSTDNAENTERENPQIPCESGDMRCANPFQRKAIQDPQFVDKNNQQLESQGALENMWAMNQMQNKDGGDILRRDDNAKNADPTHHGVHTHFYQKTHGITKNIGGYSSGIHPQVNPVNVHVIQNQESIGYNNGHGFGQSHQISNANANANANAQAFSNANNFGQYGTQFGQSNAHSSANAQAFSNSNAHQIVPVISNYGGHQGVHSSASAHASASAHSNSGGYAQTIPVNIVGRTEEDIAPTESTPVNDGKPKQVAYVPTGKKVSIIPILNIPASYNISEEPLQWIIIDQDRKEPQVLDGVNINSLKNETKHSSEENHSSEEKKDIDLKNFDEDSHIFNIIEKILLKNDSKKSYDVKNAEIRRIMFGKERVEVEMLPTLYNPIKEPNVRSNDTAEHIKIEDPVNQTSHSSARRNDPFDDKKEDIKNTTVNPLFDNSAVQPLIHEGEKNDDNFDLVTPPPDLIEETDEKLETSPPKISQVTTRKIFNQTSGKKHLFDYPTTTGVDDLINVATTTENVEQTTVYSKEHVEMASRHHSDSGDTKKAPELDEFTKEVIRNASKKVYVPPVVPLNSTDLIPKGPLKKIEVYPPGKRVEINPLRVIPKGFNGTLEPDQFYIDRRNDSNQGEIFFVSSTTESNVDSNMQAAKSLSKQRSYYHEEQPNYNNNNNDNQYQQYQQSYDSYPNNNQQYGYQPPQQYESQRGLGLSSQLRQYFKPFSQSDLRDVYFSRPDHDYYQNNYQQDQGPYYARNSRHNPQHSFKENIGSFDRGELSQKSSDYYDHEMLGAPMDNKDRLKSLPVLPENFQNLEGPTQEKLIQEYLNNDEKYLKDLIENEKKSSDVVEKDSVVGQPQEKIREDQNGNLSSPYLFNVKPNKRRDWESNDYYRNAGHSEENLDRILNKQKNMLESLKRDADHNQDVMLISYLGESVIKDIERRKNSSKKTSKTKRQILTTTFFPLESLSSDPNMNLDFSKTIDNLGTITRKTFEDTTAPLYHIRNMFGNAKNSAFSALKVVPNNFLIPSQYDIKNVNEDYEQVGAINNDLLNEKIGENNTTIKSSGTSSSDKITPNVQNNNLSGMLETFKKLGEIIRESVNSGKNTLLHVGDAAKDAKRFVMSSRHLTPRILYPKVPTLQDVNNIPQKTVLLSPHLLEFLNEKTLEKSPTKDTNFVGIGNILDSVGLSNNANKNKVDVHRVVLEPTYNLDEKTNKDWLKSLKFEDIDPNNEDLEIENNEGGVESTLDSLGKVQRSIGASNLKDFFEKIKREISKDDNQMVLGEGLNLPEQLMHPFMDQPTKQQLRQFLEENGDKSPEGPSQNDLGKILGASNPAMMEKNFRESEGSKFQNPEEMFHNKERTNFKVDG